MVELNLNQIKLKFDRRSGRAPVTCGATRWRCGSWRRCASRGRGRRWPTKLSCWPASSNATRHPKRRSTLRCRRRRRHRRVYRPPRPATPWSEHPTRRWWSCPDRLTVPTSCTDSCASAGSKSQANDRDLPIFTLIYNANSTLTKNIYFSCK